MRPFQSRPRIGPESPRTGYRFDFEHADAAFERDGGELLAGIDRLGAAQSTGFGSATGAGIAQNGSLKNLQLDTLLDASALSGADDLLQGLLTREASAVLRVTGDDNDSVSIGGDWQEYSTGLGEQATVNYDGADYKVYVNQNYDWSGTPMETELLLIKTNLV